MEIRKILRLRPTPTPDHSPSGETVATGHSLIGNREFKLLGDLEIARSAYVPPSPSTGSKNPDPRVARLEDLLNGRRPS